MSNTNYSGWLWEDSKHSVNRAKERAGMNRKKALKMMELARKRGITSDECKWSLDKKFLGSRSDANTIAVAFNGYCFIMERATMNCITMYRLPKHFGKKKTFYKTTAKCSQRNEYEAVYC